MKKYGYNYASALVGKDCQDLGWIEGLGKVRIQEIVDKAADLGIEIPEGDPDKFKKLPHILKDTEAGWKKKSDIFFKNKEIMRRLEEEKRGEE